MTTDPKPLTREEVERFAHPREWMDDSIGLRLARTCLALMDERDRRDRGTTHADGCHTWGPKHYACAEARIAELEASIAAITAANEAAKAAEEEG